jgi:hypothetical protein
MAACGMATALMAAQLLLNTLESTYYAAVLPLRLLSAAAFTALWHSCATL